MNENILRIEKIASALRQLRDDVIFIGGACSQFYVDRPDIFDFRPTKDIDLIVQAYSYKEYSDISKKLSELGFSHDTSDHAPIVRRKFEDILVDVIPDDASIVGYKEIKWFKTGRSKKKSLTLPSGTSINILTLPYYMASKLEAWYDRGKGDYLVNQDIEDIVNIIDGKVNLNELQSDDESVTTFLLNSFSKILDDIGFRRSVQGHLGFDSLAQEKAEIVIQKIKDFVALR